MTNLSPFVVAREHPFVRGERGQWDKTPRPWGYVQHDNDGASRLLLAVSRRSVVLGYDVSVLKVRTQGRVDEEAHRGDGATFFDEVVQQRSRMSGRAHPIDAVGGIVALPGVLSLTKIDVPALVALTYGIGADRDRSVRTGSGCGDE